jgi:hypothetical protein
MMKIEDVKKIADTMIDADRDRDNAFQAYADMYHLRWKLPDELGRVQWIRKFIASDPHDAVASGVRVLSALKPKIKKHPLAPDQENKARANMEERVLAWHLWSADRRRPVSVVSDAVQAALLYNSVALHVSDLENEIEVRRSMGQSTKRLEIARRSGRFTIQAFNPMDVHAKRSVYGPECVLLSQKRLASEVVAEWGKLAKSVQTMADNGEMVRYFDYWDYDNRAVWVTADTAATNAAEIGTILKPTAHELDFLPWVALMGGTDLEHLEHYKYHPMLFPLYFSQSWETLNVTRSLVVSEAISRAASPMFSDEGPNQMEADVNYGDPLKIAKPAPGNTLKALPPAPIDQGLQQIADMISSDVQRSTISRILMGGDIPSGTAYSTLNLATQTAVGALKPAKELAEKALAEMFKIMLAWVVHTNVPLLAYGNVEKSTSYGENMVIQPDEIDLSALYIDVELSPDVPTDRLQRANAASIMVQYGYPREYALEDLGVDDPQQAIRQWYFERYVQQKFDLETQREQQEVQLEGQAQQMQIQMQAQQAQMQMQQQQQMAQQPPMQQGGMPPEGMSPEGMPPEPGQGQGYNPAMGGTPAVMSMPPDQALREMVRQQTFGGEEPGYAEME